MDPEPTPVEAPTRRSRRSANKERARTSPVRLLVISLGALVLGVGLMAGAFVLLGDQRVEFVAPAGDEGDPMGGVDDPEEDGGEGQAAPEQDAGDGHEEAPEPVVLRDFDLEPTRDPFSEVIPASTTATAGDGSTDPAGDDPDSEPGDTPPATPTTGDPDGGPDEPPAGGVGCTGDDDVVCDGHLVSLLEVLRRADGPTVAIVQIDTTVYEAAAGSRITDRFEVRSIDGGCATLRFDGVEDFTVCAGERVLK
jgi:hypothetical protein